MAPIGIPKHFEQFRRRDGVEFEIRVWAEDGAFRSRWSCRSCHSLGGRANDCPTAEKSVKEAIVNLVRHRCRRGRKPD